MYIILKMDIIDSYVWGKLTIYIHEICVRRFANVITDCELF